MSTPKELADVRQDLTEIERRLAAQMVMTDVLLALLVDKVERPAILELLAKRRPEDVHWQQAVSDLRKASTVADELKKEFRYPSHQGH